MSSKPTDAEVFICLYCHQWLYGDEAWHDHLLESNHGVAKLAADHATTLPEPLE